jgi:pyruvate/2-oxoglutarate dehydrogenase complex dihydrolipoamide acyltransferase (E2) component
VEQGDVVGLLEVMKMFNPVRAAFSGTIAESLVTATQGTVVHKGQTLFRVVPDHAPPPSDPAAQERHRHAFTQSLLAKL